MEKFVLFHFATKCNDRVYQVSLMPGAPWDDIDVVLEEFKKEFAAMKIEAQEAEDKKAAEEAAKAAEQPAVEPQVLEPELVQ